VCGVLLLKTLFWLLTAEAGATDDTPPRKSKSDWTLDERPRRSLENDDDDAFEAAATGFAAAWASGAPPRESPSRSLESRLAAEGAGAVTGASLRRIERFSPGPEPLYRIYHFRSVEQNLKSQDHCPSIKFFSYQGTP